MKTIALLALSLITCPALGLNGKVDPERFRKYLASDYVKEFVEEFNSFSAQDVKDIYGYFLPKKNRADFFKNFKTKPHARGDGTVLYLEVPNRGTIKLEIVDLLQQRYKINGKSFAYDWNGDMPLQLKTIRGRFQKPQARVDDSNPIMNWIVPKAEAQGWEEVVAAALVCEEVCPIIVAATARSSIYVAAREGLIVAAESPAGTEAALEARTAVAAAERSYGKLIDNILADPEIKARIASLAAQPGKAGASKALSGALKAIEWIGKVTGSLGLGGAMVLANNSLSSILEAYDKAKIPKLIGIKCLFIGSISPETCPLVKPQIPLATRPATDPVPWCPTDKVNEYQTYTQKGDTKAAIIIRLDTDKKKPGPISALRYQVRDGQVDLNTIRLYKFKNSEIIEITQPGFSESTIAESELETKKKNYDGADAAEKEDEDMQNQVKRRENFLKDVANPSKDVSIYKGDIIKDHTADTISAVTDKSGGVAHLDQEYLWAMEVVNSEEKGAGFCTAVIEQQAKTPASAAAPAAPSTQ